MLRYTRNALVLGSLVLLSGCDNGSSSSSSGNPDTPGNQDVVVRLPDVAVPGEAATATEKQAVIHLVDIAGITSSSAADYSSKNLYLWNNETCDALSAPVADWNDVSTTPSGSDKYGPYWVIPLNKESGCINVIVRDGTDKLIDSDLRVSFGDFTDRTVSVIAGNSAVYDSRADAFRAAFGVALAEAHWVDKNTLLWPGGQDKPLVRLYYSHSSKVAADGEGKFTDRYLKLTPTTVSQQVSMRFPHLSSYAAFKLPDNANVDELLQGETVAIAGRRGRDPDFRHPGTDGGRAG
ncbi:pullulanase [Klebsiella michiganensis]|uniref:Pullulanase n=1 Tax=Klebsiella michiganensis TaxID=1134687 RepID=A0A7H4N7B5_9ENTR|nr:pullulanase [Klebsiella michiganensis]